MANSQLHTLPSSPTLHYIPHHTTPHSSSHQTTFFITPLHILFTTMSYTSSYHLTPHPFHSTHHLHATRQVCTEQERDEGVFLLSISLLDRFLTCTHIKRTHLQLVAAVCIFIASKSREAFFLSPDKLVAYTAFSITKQDLLVGTAVFLPPWCGVAVVWCGVGVRLWCGCSVWLWV